MSDLKPETVGSKGKVLLYALSTCIWCRKTKNLLDELGVAYDFIDVDLLTGEDSQKIRREQELWNPSGSFPTLVINNAKCIIGFEEDQIRKEFGK
ncbi:MAG: glutaredoxin family protein [Firmicutes bacterium]|nr:glutaredoxin family protein [Bacillota bacterium]